MPNLVASASPMVPFWIQIAAVALAPILGFAGVAAGALMKDRSDRLSNLRKDRLEIYRKLVNAYSAWESYFAVEGRTKCVEGNPEQIHYFMEKMIALVAEIDSLATEVALIASPKVAVLSQEIFGIDIKAIDLAVDAQDKKFNAAHWEMLLRKHVTTTREFQKSAMKDLGVPVRQRERRPQSVLGSVVIAELRAHVRDPTSDQE
jgi:hypothetical protein